jgi:hypothetical protein
MCFVEDEFRRMRTIDDVANSLENYCKGDNPSISKYIELYTNKNTRTILGSDKLQLKMVREIEKHPSFLGLPVASPYFLAEDILVKFRTKDLFGRYFSGKIGKDKTRVSEIVKINDESTTYLSYNDVSPFYLCYANSYFRGKEIVLGTLNSVYGMVNKETKWFKENYEYDDEIEFEASKELIKLDEKGELVIKPTEKELYDLLSNHDVFKK